MILPPPKPSQRPKFDFEDTRPGDFAWIPCFCDTGQPCELCDGTGRKFTIVRRTVSGEHRRIVGLDELHKEK